ncbi:flagellar hook-basal body complex protein [uncultured Lentibacter sp.]|uniref:flagellar hook-basal body complex protein n=1 Tax=uncultured Lentibacter sp. TaxID=1659309 RepID=UPI0026039376|nr:flagellar hook-basal body complex protein [uncultured Lentibacter sp.]
MDNASYTTLTRQSGLMREMRVIANNIANSATSGFRQEGVIFSEYVSDTGNAPSVSMALGNVRNTSQQQGALTSTGGRFDFAIEGPGFFQIETPQGARLTRAGSFTPNAEGELVTHAGYRVLDIGGAPIFIPPDASDMSVGNDGTISSDGRPLAQLGILAPADGTQLTREDGVMFRAEGELEPAAQFSVLQGFLESSNVNPIGQIARMIEVQRAYELGQSFTENESERLKNAITSFFK